MNSSLSITQLTAVRFNNTGLLTPFNSAISAIQNAVGIQAQQPFSANLNALIRSTASISQLDQQLSDPRQLVRAWGQRWTLHLFTRADFNLITSARSTEKLSNGYYLNHKEQVLIAANAIQNSGVQTWTPTTLDASLFTIFPEASGNSRLKYVILQVITARGAGFFTANSSTTKWIFELHSPKSLSLNDSISELILRYLTGFGPATLADFIKWSGIKISSVRPIWQKVTHELFRYDLTNSDSPLISTSELSPEILSSLTDKLEAQPQIMARFDSTMTGYANKDWLAPTKYQSIMWSKNGILAAPIINHGKLIGHWRYTLKNNIITFEVFTWEALSTSDKIGLESLFEQLAQKLDYQLDAMHYQLV